MNIRQYYRLSAMMSLNASLVSLLPIILFLIGIIQFPSKMWLVIASIPFIVYSFICFQNYQRQSRRYEEIDEIQETEKKLTIFNQSQILLSFLPAPSIRMVLFEPNGRMVGEVKDMNFKSFRWFLPYFVDKLIPKKYGLYNENQQLLAVLYVNKREINLLNPIGQAIGSIIQTEKKGKKETWCFKEKIWTISKEPFYTDIRIRYEDLELALLKKGWMPIEWERYFKDANTPVLTIQQGLTDEERLILFGLVAKYFCYREH
ncbi:hypothetical protein [Bacillus massilinigeriensis]|uniref:hypothetical protein n=1 Tax=Bacillus massilionigeriensis TaxID=1805475 RepID=UPI00096B479C|nr:hypothetical protein [Bacillus massilionigeriensis]